MASENQINANRINGAKARGAITPEGRLASSRNSLVHGLLSEAIILDGESAERFNALHDALIEEYQPETATEVGLVETMVVCRWRLMRVWILENSAIAHEMRKQAEANALENMPTQAVLAHRALSDHLARLYPHNMVDVDEATGQRYEARFDRQLSRAIQRFDEVRARRKKQKKKKLFCRTNPIPEASCDYRNHPPLFPA